MKQNIPPKPNSERPISTVPMAGFSAKSMPDGAIVHTWADDVELKVFLSPAQAESLARALVTRQVFVGAQKIKRFNVNIPVC